MKSLRESILDDDKKLFDDTDMGKLLIKSFPKYNDIKRSKEYRVPGDLYHREAINTKCYAWFIPEELREAFYKFDKFILSDIFVHFYKSVIEIRFGGFLTNRLNTYCGKYYSIFVQGDFNPKSQQKISYDILNILKDRMAVKYCMDHSKMNISHTYNGSIELDEFLKKFN